MKINSSIFRAYDIRGVYPQDLNEETAFAIGRSFVKFLPQNRPKIAVARDNRLSSAALHQSLISGMTEMGADMVDLGLATTPMLYFSSSYKNIPLSIMCTASHLGEGYTGIKQNKDGIPLEEEAVLAIKVEFDRLTTIASHDFELVHAERQPETINIYGPYVATIASLLSYPLYNYKVAVDLGNGNNAFVAEQLLHKVGIDYRAINSEVRDRDLQHPSNPKMQSNRSQLEHLIAEMGADLGVIWDGDCDRCYLVDWAGEVIPPEYVAIKIAGLLKKTNSYSHITADVRASFAVERELAKEEIKVKRNLILDLLGGILYYILHIWETLYGIMLVIKLCQTPNYITKTAAKIEKMSNNIEYRFHGEERLTAKPREELEEKDPKYTLNPLHPIRFSKTVREGMLYLDYVLHGGPL